MSNPYSEPEKFGLEILMEEDIGGHISMQEVTARNWEGAMQEMTAKHFDAAELSRLLSPIFKGK